MSYEKYVLYGLYKCDVIMVVKSKCSVVLYRPIDNVRRTRATVRVRVMKRILECVLVNGFLSYQRILLE